MNTIAMSLIAAAAFAVAGAATAAPRNDASAYGQAVPPNAAGRVVALTPDTRFVNVVNGETVTFEKDGRRFTWHVDTYSNVMEFSLAAIAPKTLHADGVDVYVEPDEYYRH